VKLIKQFKKYNAMTIYKLFKGFKLEAVCTSLREAKGKAKLDGTYNIIGTNNYRSSFVILNGTYFGD